MTKIKNPRKRNVIIGFSVEDYQKLAAACELTFRSKNLFIKRIVMPEVERVLKTKRGKNGTRTD